MRRLGVRIKEVFGTASLPPSPSTVSVQGNIEIFDVESGQVVSGVTSVTLFYEVGGIVRAEIKVNIAAHGSF